MISLAGTVASEAPWRVCDEGAHLISEDSEVPCLSTYKLHTEEQGMHHLARLGTEQGSPIWGQAVRGGSVSQMRCICFGERVRAWPGFSNHLSVTVHWGMVVERSTRLQRGWAAGHRVEGKGLSLAPPASCSCQRTEEKEAFPKPSVSNHTKCILQDATSRWVTYITRLILPEKLHLISCLFMFLKTN